MDGTKLDLFVAHTMHGSIGDALQAIGPIDSAPAAAWACNEMVWPALEVAQDLVASGNLPRQRYNAALRVLRLVVSKALERIIPAPATGRSVMVFTVPGEREEFGASVIARLAEAYGWKVHFAGAGLSVEEILFALGQISPDVLIIHAGLPSSLPALCGLVGRFQRVGVWPSAQVVLCGLEPSAHPPSAACLPDLAARTPIELLELMQLCPDHRTPPPTPLQPGDRGAPRRGVRITTYRPGTIRPLRPDLDDLPELIRQRLQNHYRPS